MIKKAVFFNSILLLVYFYFVYLLVLITIQYIPVNYEIAFLRIKQDEIQFLHYKIAFFVHVYSSIFLVLIGWTQFSNWFREKWMKSHRVVGKIYFFIILFLSGPSGLVMGYYANGGVLSKISFVILSFLWIFFTYRSFISIKKGNYLLHKRDAIRGFAITLSAISLRLFKYIIVFLFHPPPMDVYRIVAWMGWVFNLIIAELIIYKYFQRK